MAIKNVVAESLALLGTRQRDRVTGFFGMASSVGFDAYGCVQVYLAPPINADGKISDGAWFDIKRLEVNGDRIFDAPDFGDMGSEPGGQSKSAPPSGPR